MGKLFCILGKSGSGKDTVFKLLQADSELGLKRVVTYTTRPRREGETDGEEYYFISGFLLDRLKNDHMIIELRQYNTVQGVWSYCTVDDGQIDLGSGNYIMIATPEAFMSLRDFFGEDSAVPLYIYVEDSLRLERALKREREGGRPDYEEMCRRFLADKKDFSDEILEKCGVKKYYENAVSGLCAREIKNDILSELK